MQELATGTGNRDKLLRGALECLQDRGYAQTSSRDIARASGANVASINYHFGSKDALLNEALGRCFEMWNARIQEAFVAAGDASVQDQLGAILTAAIDSFAQLRPSINACIESFAPALRDDELRARLAAGYAGVRNSSVELSHNALAGMGIEPPGNLPAIASVLIAVCDGLMLQWIADPEATPNAAETLNALTALGAIASIGISPV